MEKHHSLSYKNNNIMNSFTKALLCTGMIMGTVMSASAFNLVSPTEDEVTKVKSLGKIMLKWDAEPQEFPETVCLLLDNSGATIATGTPDLSWDDYSAYDVTFSPTISAPGTYTVVVPANMAPDNNNKEYRLTYEIEASTEPAGKPTAITPEDGSSITQGNGVEFNQIQLQFANDVSIEVNESLISLTNQDGTPVSFTIGGFYSADDPMLQYMPNPFVNIDFNGDGYMPSGTYTLTVNPGAFTSPNGMYTEKIILTYYYTRTKPDRDETPLEITSALMGGAIATSPALGVYEFSWDGTDAVNVTPDMKVAEFVGTNNVGEGNVGTGFLLNFNHGAKSEYVVYYLIDKETNENMVSGELVKQADGSFLLHWASTTKLIENKHYDLEFHTFNNIQDKVEFGDGACLTFIGTSEAFKFSSAKFVTVVPSIGETLNSLDQNKLTVLFTEPVKASAVVNLGMGMSEPSECESSNGTEFDNVWYVYIPDNIMLTYPEVDITVTAFGQDGNIVAGNSGFESTSGNMMSYTLTLCQPRIRTKQTNSHVAEINKFVVYSPDGRAINTSWMDYPYVVNSKGERVAEINQEYFTNEWGDKEPFKTVLWSPGDEYTREPLELEFQVIPTITEKGEYTLVFPTATFNIGSQFDSDTSVAQEYPYYVVDFFPVTYTVDSNTITLNPVELGNNVELFIDVNDGWKLETLLLNGNDVTENVANGVYTSEPAASAMNFQATFAFDGVVLTPSGVDDVVSDLNLRAWSEAQKLYVSGLKDGQIINIYTIGGSKMASAVIADGNDTMTFSLAEGVYIVTVTEGQNTVALKLINK